MRKHYFNLTLASVISAIAVVCMHVNTKVFQVASVKTAGWLSAHLLISISYFAVPVFFMISGAALMDYRERYDTREFFKARLKKVMIPFLFWSLFALFFLIVTGHKYIGDLTFWGVIKGIFGTEYQPNYWFLLKLFSAYLMIPVFSLIPKDKRENIFLYILMVSLILEKLVPFLNDVLPFTIPKAFIMPMAIETFWFLFAGYYLQNRVFSGKERAVIYALGVLGFGIQVIGTYVLSIRKGIPDETVRGSAALPNLLYSVAIFVLLKQVSGKLEQNPLIRRTVLYLGGYTFGIYLVHRYILDTLSLYIKAGTWNFVLRLVLPCLVIPASVAVIWLIRKIPVVGKAILP